MKMENTVYLNHPQPAAVSIKFDGRLIIISAEQLVVASLPSNLLLFQLPLTIPSNFSTILSN